MKVPRSEVVRSLVFIGDLHFFSRYALMPTPYISPAGQVTYPSPGQEVINAGWESFQNTCDELEVDSIILMGDVLHGQNPIERGTMLIDPATDEQVAYAIDSLRPIVEKPCRYGERRKLFGISGSGYHKGGRGSNPERTIIETLGGTFWGSISNTIFAPSKKVFRVQHGESASYVYREMLLGRELSFQKEAEAMGDIPHADVIVGGHWHRYIHIEEKGVHVVQCPCWMAFEPSKPYLKSYPKMQPQIGGVIVMIDEADRLIVWHYLYPKPNIVDFVREV